VERRLGTFNLFQEAVAVDYWTLNLSMPEQKRILQELVYLGDLEPGKNFVEARCSLAGARASLLSPSHPRTHAHMCVACTKT
jgi:hypothetical protein